MTSFPIIEPLWHGFIFKDTVQEWVIETGTDTTIPPAQTGWRKAVAMILTAIVGVAIAYIAVSFQYGTPGDLDLEDGYATQFLVIGAILGLLAGDVFRRFQKSWIVWILASAAGILSARFIPTFFSDAGGLSLSTKSAWFGTLGFALAHIPFLPIKQILARRDLNG